MKVGGKRQLRIPPNLPMEHAVLGPGRSHKCAISVFDVELLGVK